MNPEQLVNILGYTYSPDQSLRSQAEAAIKELPTVDGAPQTLLQIVGAGEQVAREIRLAAAIAFKNIAKTYWEPMMRITKAECVPDASKPAIREALFQVLLAEGDKAIRDLLGVAINQMARVDYPNNWPQLLPEILTQVQSGDPLRMHNSLLALRQVSKRLEYKSGEGRAPLEVIINSALPLAQQLVRQLIETENNSIEAALIMKLCLKILWSCTQFSLPAAACGNQVDPAALEHLGQWLELMAAIIAKPLPEADEPNAQPPGQPKSVEERNAWPWWKLKKWAMQVLARWFHRYGMLAYADDDSRKFAELFSATYAPKLLEPVMQVLSLVPSGRFCTDRCSHLAFVYMESAVQLKNTYAMLKPHMRSLLFDIVFPRLCVSESDAALFESDPVEYVRKFNDVMEDFNDPKLSAMTLLETVMNKRKKDNLDVFLGFLTDTLNQYAAGSGEARKKDGVLVCLCVLAEQLKGHKKYKKQLEPLLVAHVFPEFQSPIGFLRSRAASLTSCFFDIKFSDPSNIAKFMELNLAALRDPCLPVQVEAANGLRNLIELEGTESIILPILPELLNEFFRIMGEIGSDTVVAALDAIINKFGDELIPHASLLVQKLCESFLSYASEGNEDDEAAMAASQCIEAISTVLDTIVKSENHTQMFIQIQPYLIPVLQLVLRADGSFMEFLESALEIFTFVTYFVDTKVDKNDLAAVQASKQLQLQALAPYIELFPLMVHCFHSFAFDFMSNMMSPIDNMIGYGGDLFLSAVEPTSGQSYVQLMISMAVKVYDNDGRSNAREEISATHLLLSLLHNCHGRVDEHLPPILELVLNRLNPSPKQRQVNVRIPEGVAPGTMIELGSMPGTVPCPAGTPGSEASVTVTFQQEAPTDKFKVSLLQVINSAFFYNPVLTCSWLDQVPGRSVGFFAAWTSEMDNSSEWNHFAAKLASIALASILNTPLEMLTPVFQENLSKILMMQIRFLKEIEEANKDDGEGGGDEEEEEEEEEEEGDDDDYEDEDDGDEDVADQEEIDYLKSLRGTNAKLMKYALEEADDEDDFYGEEDNYVSPIDDVDELVLFFQAIQNASARSPQVFGQIQAALPPDMKQVCAALLTKANAKAQ